jgi:branched-chain amino acid transport system ATP-binding protein
MRATGGPEAAVGDVLLSVENVSLSFGGVKAVSDVSFDIRKGEIRAIIGPNGAGKTSMLNVINGFITRSRGASHSRVRRAPKCVLMKRPMAASPAHFRMSRCFVA